MTDEHASESTTVESHTEEHGTADAHGVADGHGAAHDDDGHGGEALGPIDWGLWSYAIVGAIGGVIVIAFFLFALGGLPG